MKRTLLALLGVCLLTNLYAQEKKAAPKAEPLKKDLPDMRKCIIAGQNDVALYAQNMKDHAKESDVLQIVNTAERYMDSVPKPRDYADVLLRKHFMSMRNFFLTVTNKTTVSTSFLYNDVPYRFCAYGDTAVALYITAMKDGDTYSAANMTEKQIGSKVFGDCVLPALKALSEFKESDPKYFGLSLYFGCKDVKGQMLTAPAVKPYCLTFVARFADLRKYIDGNMTADDLVDGAEVYLSNDESANDLRRIRVNID